MMLTGAPTCRCWGPAVGPCPWPAWTGAPPWSSAAAGRSRSPTRPGVWGAKQEVRGQATGPGASVIGEETVKEQDSHVLRTPVEQQLHLPRLLCPPGDDLEVSEHHGMS